MITKTMMVIDDGDNDDNGDNDNNEKGAGKLGPAEKLFLLWIHPKYFLYNLTIMYTYYIIQIKKKMLIYLDPMSTRHLKAVTNFLNPLKLHVSQT